MQAFTAHIVQFQRAAQHQISGCLQRGCPVQVFHFTGDTIKSTLQPGFCIFQNFQESLRCPLASPPQHIIEFCAVFVQVLTLRNRSTGANVRRNLNDQHPLHIKVAHPSSSPPDFSQFIQSFFQLATQPQGSRMLLQHFSRQGLNATRGRAQGMDCMVTRIGSARHQGDSKIPVKLFKRIY